MRGFLFVKNGVKNAIHCQTWSNGGQPALLS